MTDAAQLTIDVVSDVVCPWCFLGKKRLEKALAVEGGDIAVRFSGIVRAGDPFSLVADDAQLRRLRFGWQVPVKRGVAEYVPWFKGYVR